MLLMQDIPLVITFKLPASTTSNDDSFTNIYDDFGIWLLGYRTELVRIVDEYVVFILGEGWHLIERHRKANTNKNFRS